MVYQATSRRTDEPVEMLDMFNFVKGYGEVWCEVVDRESFPYLFVVAGVCGNMSGVPVARFARASRSAAIQFARDFEQGKCFVLQNGPRWCDYINAMQGFRKVDAGKYQRLISLGRSTGISLNTGNTVSQRDVQAAYESGRTAEQV